MNLTRRRGDSPDVIFPGESFPSLEPENALDHIKTALAVLVCFRGRAVPQLDAEAIERRLVLAVVKLEGRA